MAYLHDLVQHLTSLTGTPYTIMTRLGGPVGEVLLVAEYADAAAWEAAGAKIGPDTAFHKMVEDSVAAGMFIGTTESALWRVN
jgi:hypothetical protein